MDAPLLDRIHHTKIPVTDLRRSCDWYTSRLGYQVDIVFVEDGRERGLALSHPSGGPDLALRLIPERSDGLADFDFCAIGVPDKDALEALAQRLTDLTDHHTALPHGQAIRIENPRESAGRR